jgi:hypothetical protein
VVSAAGLAVSILTADARGQGSEMRVGQFVSADTIELVSAGKTKTLRKGDHAGPWTLLEIIPADSKSSRLAVLEDFSRLDGPILFVDAAGIQLDLPKSLEPTFPDPAKVYWGHTLDQILNSSQDLLAEEMLASPTDPDPAKIFQCFPPIRKMKTITFVGTHDNIDKVGFDYEGRSPNFDPAVYDTNIVKIRDDGKVWNGLAGGWLPVIRYVYPVDTNHWTEMLAFAPLRVSDGNQRIQPVWYRVARMALSNGLATSIPIIPFRRAPNMIPRLSMGISWICIKVGRVR